MGDFEIKVQTIATGDSYAEVSAHASEPFTESRMKRLSNVINHVVENIQTSVDKGDDDALWAMTEINLDFGIDFELETGIPIIGPIFGARAKSGATFQVHVTFKRQES